MAYTVANPHPGFGTDPNIINEYGHTRYPRYVTKKDSTERVVVDTPEQEEEVTGKVPEHLAGKTPEAKANW